MYCAEWQWKGAFSATEHTLYVDFLVEYADFFISLYELNTTSISVLDFLLIFGP